MSTLAMALAAALVAGSALEKVSGETRQVLDLCGEWEGTSFLDREPFRCRLARNTLCLQHDGQTVSFPIRLSDVGEGKLIVGMAGLPLDIGTWQQRGDCVTVSLRSPETGEEGRVVLKLRRVKPRK